MRLATVRVGGRTHAARMDADDLVLLEAPDVGTLLGADDPPAETRREAGGVVPFAGADLAPLVPRPSKILCVGLNYQNHILETGRELPRYPTLFAKFAEALIGARDPLVLPAVSTSVDWEVELGVVVGRRIWRASEEEAADAIAGFTVVNDVTARDWQRRTLQWLQGKTFVGSTPVGPVLVSLDELGPDPDLEVRCSVDGTVMQADRTSQLLFKPAQILAYASQVVPLNPGDLVATGTPAGIGEARTPPVFLAPGQVLSTLVEGIGECRNECRAETGPGRSGT